MREWGLFISSGSGLSALAEHHERRITSQFLTLPRSDSRMMLGPGLQLQMIMLCCSRVPTAET
jgi:hypothetical protein